MSDKSDKVEESSRKLKQIKHSLKRNA